MKLNISIIAAISFFMFTGCNNSGQEQTDNATNSFSDFEPEDTENVRDPYPEDADKDNTEAEEVESDTSYVQTEVIERDTVAARVTYDVNRRTIEQVDTVGATRKYEVEHKVVKKTVLVDTITEVVDKQKEIEFEKGNYEVVNREVAQDSVTKTIENPAAVNTQNSKAPDQPEISDPEQKNTVDSTRVQMEEIPVESSQDTSAEANENAAN